MVDRIKKVNALIKKEISGIIEENLDPEKSLVTVSHVKTTEDLRNTKVFVSVFPYDKKDKILNKIEEILPKIQSILNKKIVLKYIPKIEILFDESFQHGSDMEDLFKKIERDKMNG